MGEESKLDLKTILIGLFIAAGLTNILCCGMCGDDDKADQDVARQEPIAQSAAGDANQGERFATEEVKSFVNMMGEGKKFLSGDDLTRFEAAVGSCEELKEEEESCRKQIVDAMVKGVQDFAKRKDCNDSRPMGAFSSFLEPLSPGGFAVSLPRAEALKTSVNNGIASCKILTAEQAIKDGELLEAESSLRQAKAMNNVNPSVIKGAQAAEGALAEKIKRVGEEMDAESKRIGQSVSSKEMTTTVKSARTMKSFKNKRQTALLSQARLTPSEGYVFLVIDVSQKNVSNELASATKAGGLDDSEFKLVTASGASYRQHSALGEYYFK